MRPLTLLLLLLPSWSYVLSCRVFWMTGPPGENKLLLRSGTKLKTRFLLPQRRLRLLPAAWKWNDKLLIIIIIISSELWIAAGHCNSTAAITKRQQHDRSVCVCDSVETEHPTDCRSFVGSVGHVKRQGTFSPSRALAWPWMYLVLAYTTSRVLLWGPSKYKTVNISKKKYQRNKKEQTEEYWHLSMHLLSKFTFHTLV